MVAYVCAGCAWYCWLEFSGRINKAENDPAVTALYETMPPERVAVVRAIAVAFNALFQVALWPLCLLFDLLYWGWRRR